MCLTFSCVIFQFFDTRTVLPPQSQEFIIVGRDANGGKKGKKQRQGRREREERKGTDAKADSVVDRF